MMPWMMLMMTMVRVEGDAEPDRHPHAQVVVDHGGGVHEEGDAAQGGHPPGQDEVEEQDHWIAPERADDSPCVCSESVIAAAIGTQQQGIGNRRVPLAADGEGVGDQGGDDGHDRRSERVPPSS